MSALEPRRWVEVERPEGHEWNDYLDMVAVDSYYERLDREDAAEEERLARVALERLGYDPVCVSCGRLTGREEVCHNCSNPDFGPGLYGENL